MNDLFDDMERKGLADYGVSMEQRYTALNAIIGMWGLLYLADNSWLEKYKNG